MTSQSSKYKFFKSKRYVDKFGKVYHYEGKYMGVFQFFVFNEGKCTMSRLFEHHIDELDLKLINNL